jgi:hypothetical protein
MAPMRSASAEPSTPPPEQPKAEQPEAQAPLRRSTRRTREPNWFVPSPGKTSSGRAADWRDREATGATQYVVVQTRTHALQGNY